MVIACRRQPLAGDFVEIGGEVGVGFGHLPSCHPGGQGRVRLDDQAVERKMFGFQSNGLVERRLPGRWLLVGQAEDEIQTEILESDRPRQLHRLFRLRPV